MSDNTDIIVEELNKIYESGSETVVALQGVEFTVTEGELVCVVGPSGCGKSTLLKVLAGIEEPDQGTAVIDGDRKERGVAYIPQESALLPWRTLIQNAAIGLELEGVFTTGKRDRVLDLVEMYGLHGFEDQLAAQLSGGMKQRTAIIRALASDPAVLLCDEPLSSVDYVTRLELNNKFKNMCKVRGVTTIYVTHDIEEAIFLGDRVLVMSDRPGRIVNRYECHLSVGNDSAIKARQAPEFSDLFDNIWDDLGQVHV